MNDSMKMNNESMKIMKESLKMMNEFKNQIISVIPNEENLKEFNEIIEKKSENITQQCLEIEELIPSFNKLKEWSGKQKCSVLFDSKIDGDGANNVLIKKVINQSNLYFIRFDNQNNVFGGYVGELIRYTNNNIEDPNSFIFSLIRNGDIKHDIYKIKESEKQYAFCLNSDNATKLYKFGMHNDIGVYKTDNSESRCNQSSYIYEGENFPFVDNHYFKTKRTVVIKME
ncbi:TLDc domain-containing protein [Entamoeba marina]